MVKIPVQPQRAGIAAYSLQPEASNNKRLGPVDASIASRVKMRRSMSATSTPLPPSTTMPTMPTMHDGKIRNDAAIKIQALYRGFAVRKKLSELVENSAIEELVKKDTSKTIL